MMINIRDFEAMAMLDLADAERAALSGFLGDLTEGFAVLEQVDTDGAEPLVSVLSLNNILREDIAGKLLSRVEVLSNAPVQYDGYFQVPGTLD